VVCIALYGRATRSTSRFATITGKGFRPRVIDLGRGRWVATAAILAIVTLQFLPIAYLVFSSFLPTFGLTGPVWEHLTFANYQAVTRNPQLVLSLSNSFVIGVASATVVMAVTAVVAWVMVRSRLRAAAVLDQLVSLPLVLPGIVLGVAILVLYLRSPVPVYGTVWIFVLAYVTTYLPYGLRYAHPGILRIHPELEESAQIAGASWLGVFRRVVVPLVLPALFAGWIFVFLISIRELSVAALLYTQRSPVIATAMLDLWRNGNVNQVTAFGTIVALASITFAIVTYRVSRRFGIQA
jgi:iron(III) transport system permease protein